MESSGGFSFNDTKQTMRKKRSDRRPRHEIQQENNNSSLSSSPPSNNGSKGPNDENAVANHHRKILNLNQSNSRASFTNSELETPASSDDKDTGADTSEVFASNCKDTKYDDGHNSGSLDADSDPKGVDNVVKKVKLKVGGVIRTIHTKPSILKPPHHSKQKQNSQNSDPQDTGSGLRGIPWKDFSRSGFSVGKTDSSRRTTTEESIIKNRKSVNNSKRATKKRVLDDNDEDDDDDAELRYLAKMKLKSTKVDDEEEGGNKKHRKMSSVLKMESLGSSKVEKEKKKLKSEDTDYTGEERASPGEDSGREMTVTTRRKALQSGRDVSGDVAASVVEFPHGLPPAPPRKQKEKLSEVEYQLKKAEAAQRRKIQAAKAAQESEAEAIRKILGQDSSRKKRENKMKQRQEELAQERSLNAATLSSNTVRLMIGPTGTVVTFSDDIGLPNIFETRTCSYPPPREKCAGPFCSKPFKYRDSRSKLPLCSLECYKAVQEEKTETGAVY